MLSLTAYCRRNRATRTVGNFKRSRITSATAAADTMIGNVITATAVTHSIAGMVCARRFHRVPRGSAVNITRTVQSHAEAAIMCGVSSSDRVPDAKNPPADASTREVVRLIGVYNADSTLRGELSYWIGARLGRAHCSLCDITHGLVRERSAWTICRATLPVPFVSYHRDDQPDAVRAAIGDSAPAVVAETMGGTVRLLGPTELAECQGSIEALLDAIEQKLAQDQLAWPTSS